jgi:replicative DNA helicase
MSERDHAPAPYDETAEQALLGALLLRPGIMDDLKGWLLASDFYVPRNRHIYAAIAALHEAGEPIDPVSVWHEIERSGLGEEIGGPAYLISMQANCPAVSSAQRYGRIVAKMSAYRKVMREASEVWESAKKMQGEPDELAERLAAAMSDVAAGVVERVPAGLYNLGAFLGRPEEERAEWVVPGLIRVGWRVMVVAPEGIGKSVLLRQVGIAASQGVHPFTRRRIEPSKALIVDLENPGEAIDDVCKPIVAKVQQVVRNEYDDDRVWLWHQPGGIDLRSRRGKADLEAVIRDVRPQLLCIGPVYKMYRMAKNETHELAALDVQNILDDLRTRYGFGLLMEHHAPKGDGKGKREMDPYGTVLWKRWPELGFGLVPTAKDADTLLVGRFRGDRLQNEWPEKLVRGVDWPWEGVWRSGTFRPSASSVRCSHPSIAEIDDEPPF